MDRLTTAAVIARMPHVLPQRSHGKMNCVRPVPPCFADAAMTTTAGPAVSGTPRRAGPGGSGLFPAAALFEMLCELVVERLDVRASGQLRDLELNLV
jgi:hypothetical protein